MISICVTVENRSRVKVHDRVLHLFPNCVNSIVCRVRNDSLTAAVNNLSQEREFQSNYRSLLDHFGIQGHRINVRSPHENGDCESLHGKLKDYIDQRLILRGHRDFESRDEWIQFVNACVARKNTERRGLLNEELAELSPLPPTDYPLYTQTEVTVRSDSVIRVKQSAYSIPSKFIGMTLQVRIHAECIELWHNNRMQLSMPRLFGKDKVSFDYRHVIDSLVRKPGAFAGYKYREYMFPTIDFRRAYDWLSKQHDERRATREYLKILYMAKHDGQQIVEEALQLSLNSSAVRADAIRELIAQTNENHPAMCPLSIGVEPPELDAYDSLLEHKEVLDDQFDNADGTIGQSATDTIRSGWPYEEASTTDDATGRAGACGASGSRELDASELLERTGSARVSNTNAESSPATPAAIETREIENVVGDQLATLPAASPDAPGSTQDGRIPESHGQHSAFRQTRIEKDVAAQRLGGTTGPRGLYGMLCTMCALGAASTVAQARAAAATVAEKTRSLFGLDHRRSGLRSTEPRRDGSTLHADRRTLRTIEHSAQQQLAIRQVGTDLQRSHDHSGSHRSAGPPQHHPRAKRIKHKTRRSRIAPQERSSSYQPH